MTTAPFSEFDSSRYRLLTETGDVKDGAACVLYWMGRDQRVEDNYAMLAARGIAKEQVRTRHTHSEERSDELNLAVLGHSAPRSRYLHH